MKPLSLFSPKTVSALLTFLTVVVVGMFVINELWRSFDVWTPGRPLLDAAHRLRLTEWSGAALLLICAALTMRIGLLTRKTETSYGPHWIFLALVFTGLSVTKATSVHSYAMESVRSIDAWIGMTLTIPALAILCLCVLGVPIWKFLSALDPSLRKMLFVGGSMFLLGAIAMEAIAESLWYSVGRGTALYIMASTIENSLEMLGCVVLIYALMVHAREGGTREKIEASKG